METLPHKLKYFLVPIAILASGVFLVSSGAQAILAPQVYFTNMEISKNNFQPGEEIRGTVSLWNYEEFVVSSLSFRFQLLGNEVDGVPTEMIDSQGGEEVFSLLPGEETTKSFSYTLPSNLPTGDFVLTVQLISGRGEEMAWIDKVITVGGEGKFLTLDDYWIVKDGQKLPVGAGVNYQPGEIPQVTFDVTNDSNFTIVAFPKIITYKRNVGGEVIRTQEEESVALEPGEKRTLELSLPQLVEPDSYLSGVRCYDPEDLNSISNTIYFRWIIVGDDAEVTFVEIDKPSYEEGEEAKVKVQLAGPASYEELSAGEGILEVEVTDEEGNIVGQSQETIQLEDGEAVVNIPLTGKVTNPKVKTKLVKGGEVLDQYEFETMPPSEVPEAPPEPSFFEKNKEILLAGGALIVAIGALVYYSRSKKARPPLVLVLFILVILGIFLSSSALAATEVADSPCRTNIIINSPLPRREYNTGDTIHVSGRFNVHSCSDGLFFNKIQFFLTEDREIPIQTRNCCGDCCGAHGTYYGTCRQNISECNNVKILNTAGYKTRLLETTYPRDVLIGHSPYAVRFSRYLTIPQDLGFSGPARLYVQYSGTHWNSHWHWNITYQPVYINGRPQATDLQVTENNYCDPRWSAWFSWKFEDPDSGDRQSFYQIQIDDSSDFSSPVVDSGKVRSSCRIGERDRYAPPPGSLDYDTTYYWRVKVWDNHDALSSCGYADGWCYPPSSEVLLTPSHPYPEPNFSWSPSHPTAGEVVEFTDETVWHDSAGSWSWDFGDGGSSNEQHPNHVFEAANSYRVTLTVCDLPGCCCSISKSIEIKLPLPEYKEIPPILWLKKILASVSNLFLGEGWTL